MEGREIIPGVTDTFTETGIDGDVINAWSLNHARSIVGNFEKMTPVQHYEEYFQEQDEKYAKVGKPGLFQAIMGKSNPQMVAAFDQLVDEFNANLTEIINNKDTKTVQEYVDRANLLKKKTE